MGEIAEWRQGDQFDGDASSIRASAHPLTAEQLLVIDELNAAALRAFNGGHMEAAVRLMQAALEISEIRRAE